MSDRRISERAVDAIDEALELYGEGEDILFELIPFPYPHPQNPQMMQFGLSLGFMLPTPSLAPGEFFFVSGQWPDVLLFERPENVKQVVHDMIEQLRSQKANWLKGTN